MIVGRQSGVKRKKGRPTLLNNSLTPEQQAAIDRIYSHDQTILVAGTGVGKTVMALTAMKELIEEGAYKRFIVACPAKVLEKNIWSNEVKKWPHLKGIRVTEIAGVPKTRATLMARTCDVMVVSLNNLDWLLKQKHGAQGILVDELSKAAGKQTRGLRSKKTGGCFIWRVGMTATPVAQDFQKLFNMCRIIDCGESFGRNKQNYLNKFFTSDYNGYNWTLNAGAAPKIMRKIASLVHMIEDNKAQVLPPLRQKVIKFDMPDDTRQIYNDMRNEMVIEKDDLDVEASNAAVRDGKLRQIASGFVYVKDQVTTLDHARLVAAAKWVEGLNGEPGIIFYEFVEQKDQLERKLKKTNIELAQVRSMSHGIDGLQYKYADVLFYHPLWSRDSMEQATGRVWRQGQTKPVTVTTLFCRNTLDDVVVARVEGRAEWMELFKQHMKGN